MWYNFKTWRKEESFKTNLAVKVFIQSAQCHILATTKYLLLYSALFKPANCITHNPTQWTTIMSEIQMFQWASNRISTWVSGRKLVDIWSELVWPLVALFFNQLSCGYNINKSGNTSCLIFMIIVSVLGWKRDDISYSKVIFLVGKMWSMQIWNFNAFNVSYEISWIWI